MDLNYIKKLIKLVSESGVDELEIEEEGQKVRIAKRSAPAATVSSGSPNPGPMEFTVHAPGAPAHVPAAAPPAAAPGTQRLAEAETKYHEIKSPIVGTFYRSPAPDAAPFVQVGADVAPGTVLCIVEAMKLMNEIECDVSGKVAKILVENGQPIEYDQTLFLIDLA